MKWFESLARRRTAGLASMIELGEIGISVVYFLHNFVNYRVIYIVKLYQIYQFVIPFGNLREQKRKASISLGP